MIKIPQCNKGECKHTFSLIALSHINEHGSVSVGMNKIGGREMNRM